MGSCISKSKTKKKPHEDYGNVHDKLVISQQSISSSVPNMKTAAPFQKPPSPAPSSSSTASFSSFSCSGYSRGAMDSSMSSLSSCSSSVLSVKDRSFSDEFLLSCVKENPRVIGLKPVINDKDLEKTASSTNKIRPLNLESPSRIKPPVAERPRISVSTPKKRARAGSPTLVSQKSFRKEQNYVCSVPNRGLRSPSPSRRFNREANRSIPTNGTNENSVRQAVVSKGDSFSPSLSGVKRERFRPPTAGSNSDLIGQNAVLVRKKDSLSQQVTRRGVAVEDGKCSQEMDAVLEDINNPLIALDCFIFL